MNESGFTVPEFIQLLVASSLAGLLAGGLLVYLYVRLRRRRCLRQQDSYDESQNKAHQSKHTTSDGSARASVIDVRRQTPSIPIQAPPPDEDATPSAHEISSDLWAEAGYLPAGRPNSNLHYNSETSSSRLVSRTLSSVAAVGGPNHPSPRRFTIRNSRHSRHSPLASARNSNQGAAGIPGYLDRSLTSADLTLSRTTTAASTLPPYDTLSSAPPRYPSSQRSSNSPSLVSPDQPDTSLIPPLPPHPWWIKQDNSERF